MFVDEARVKVMGGRGGNGVVGWHREPYKPKGGPDGGDGGHGGDVILRADSSVGTLLDVRDHPHIRARSGGHGQGSRRHGARAEDRVVLVPPGTLVYDDEETLLADLAVAGEEIVVARGGRGGRGNARFASPTRRAPAFAEHGEPGEERGIRLELRLLADAGLVGFPNAGKSTLIARISAARPKIAAYPFTTLQPNLGVVKTDDGSFVVADIPGLVPGAHEGKGLGHRFLRHVSRAAVLVFLVDLAADDRDPAHDFSVLRAELEAFDRALAERPALVVATKLDVARDRLDDVRRAVPDAIPLSAVTGEGVDEFRHRLQEMIEEVRAGRPTPTGYIRHVVREEPIEVRREGDAWRVYGRRAERVVAMADLDNPEAVEILQKRLLSLGVERALETAGARAGDEVRIGEAAFDFEPESG